MQTPLPLILKSRTN